MITGSQSSTSHIRFAEAEAREKYDRLTSLILEEDGIALIKSHTEEPYVSELMRKVGLDPAYRFRYPHQFSGGQRQRIGVARALALRPSVIVCDEAVAALDVSIQAQVLNLFMQLKQEYGLTYFFISHNLGVVSHISDRVVIMYLGRIVEQGKPEAVFDNPQQPRTQDFLRKVLK